MSSSKRMSWKWADSVSNFLSSIKLFLNVSSRARMKLFRVTVNRGCVNGVDNICWVNNENHEWELMIIIAYAMIPKVASSRDS